MLIFHKRIISFVQMMLEKGTRLVNCPIFPVLLLNEIPCHIWTAIHPIIMSWILHVDSHPPHISLILPPEHISEGTPCIHFPGAALIGSQGKPQ